MLERNIEKLLLASRWLLAPIYVGLSVGILAIGVKFFLELWHLMAEIVSLPETQVVLVILALVDMALVASLLVMVMFSGYENFVSRIDAASDVENLDWLGKLDAGTLKIKVAVSIVAISSIHLLRAFMNAEHIANDKLMWLVIIHLTFVVSALLLGVLDKLVFGGRDH